MQIGQNLILKMPFHRFSPCRFAPSEPRDWCSPLPGKDNLVFGIDLEAEPNPTSRSNVLIANNKFILLLSNMFGTPGSMNSLFSDFFRECWRGNLRGVRNYLGDIWEGF